MTGETYDPEGKLTSMLLNGQTTAGVLSDSSRGEVIKEPSTTPNSTMANGLKLSVGPHSVGPVGILSTTTYDARMGTPTSWPESCTGNCTSASSSNPCAEDGTGTYCPSGSYTYDAVGRMSGNYSWSRPYNAVKGGDHRRFSEEFFSTKTNPKGTSSGPICLPSSGAFPEAAENLVARVVEIYLNNMLEEQMADPQARDGGFSTDIFQRYQRSKQRWCWRSPALNGKFRNRHAHFVRRQC